MRRFGHAIKNILTEGRNAAACRWTLLDIVTLTAFITIFISKDQFHLCGSILSFLRARFFILTKEPKLFYYLVVYINSVIVKGVSLLFLFAFMKARKVHFFRDIVSPGKVPAAWEALLPLYLIACFIFQIANMANPLNPSIPFDSVFIEAKIIGNIVIIFSVLFVAPFAEEVLFRGFFYPALNKYMGIFPAIMVTSLIFVSAHYPQLRGEYTALAVVFILSVMITYVRAKTGSTVIAIIMHHLYNLTCVISGFIFLKF